MPSVFRKIQPRVHGTYEQLTGWLNFRFISFRRFALRIPAMETREQYALRFSSQTATHASERVVSRNFAKLHAVTPHFSLRRIVAANGT